MNRYRIGDKIVSPCNVDALYNFTEKGETLTLEMVNLK